MRLNIETAASDFYTHTHTHTQRERLGCWRFQDFSCFFISCSLDCSDFTDGMLRWQMLIDNISQVKPVTRNGKENRTNISHSIINLSVSLSLSAQAHTHTQKHPTLSCVWESVPGSLKPLNHIQWVRKVFRPPYIFHSLLYCSHLLKSFKFIFFPH